MNPRIYLNRYTCVRDVGIGHLNEFIIFQFILDAQVLGSSNEGFNVTMHILKHAIRVYIHEVHDSGV